MKQLLTTLLLITLFSFKANEEKQMLTVKFTVDDWQQKLNILEWTKNVLKNSDVPSKVVVAVSDSLTKFENEIAQQVKLQLPNEKK